MQTLSCHIGLQGSSWSRPFRASSHRRAMEDLSAEDSQQALNPAQQEKFKACLSERNVVELVSKLQALGLLSDDLLHSINGQEYITAEYLRQEVAGAVDSAGGRIATVDLPAVLAVDLLHCERAAMQAVAGSSGQLQLLQGELLTQGYFDSLAEEVDDLLQVAGSVTAGDLAQRFKLATDLVLSMVSKHLGTRIHGRLDGQLLHTDAYIARIKARVRGALRAATVPVSIPQLLKVLSLLGLSSAGSVVNAVITELVQTGELQGQLRGGGMTWTPASFSRSQHDAVRAFYQQNGYIGFDSVTKHGIANPRQHMQSAFPGGIALDTVFVDPSLLQQLDAAVEDAITSASWCDLQALLPPVLTAADVGALLGHSSQLQAAERSKDPSRAATVLASTCVVSRGFVDALQAQASQEARRLAEAALQQRVAVKQAPAASGAPQGKDTAKAGAKADAGPNSDPDDWESGRKGGKKGKAGKKGKPAAAGSKGKGAAAPAGAPGRDDGRGKGARGEDQTLSQQLGVAGLTALVEQWQPDVGEAGHDGMLARALAESVRAAAVVEYESTITAVFVAGAEARRRRREQMAAALDAAFQQYQLLRHGCSSFAADAPTSASLQRHLVRTRGADIADGILQYQRVDLEVAADTDEQPLDSGQAMESAPLMPAQRSKTLKALPPDVAAAAQAAVDSLANADAQATEDALLAAAEAAGLRLRRVNRKQEQALLQQHRAQLQQRLEAETEPALVLSQAAPLLLAKVQDIAVSVPGKALAAVIQRLKDVLQQREFQLLQEFHDVVVDLLKAHAQDEDPAEVSGLQAKADMMTSQIKSLVLALPA